MIKITINGETRLFEPGMTVYDIIEEFDDNYTTDTCAVRVNDKRLSLEDEITEDCEMELLTFRDLGASRPVEQFSADQSENPFGNDDEVTQEDFEKYTMLAFHQMLDDGYLDVGNFETDDDEVSFELFNGFIEGMNGYSYRNVSDEAASDEIVSDEDTSEPVVLDGTVSDESVFDGTISDEEDDTDRDPLADALETAEAIGVEVILAGVPPVAEPLRGILAAAVGECSTNTVKTETIKKTPHLPIFFTMLI